MHRYDPNWATSYLEAHRKEDKEFWERIPLYEAEWPPGFLEAWDRYPAFESDSLQEIWESLSNWHKYEKGSPDGAREWVTEFQARILEAVRKKESVYLKKLIKAIETPDFPDQLRLDCVHAAVNAFVQLFACKGLRSKDDWPTKQEVRRRTEQILKDAGRTLPVERHWPRIFRKAGLSSLLSVTFGPARRSKKK
jgi:hypothetical protein